MANLNIQSIKMGAPSSIEGGASPNAELSVQSMSNCELVKLHDEGGVKCTKNGALQAAMELIKQYNSENSL